MNAEYLLDAIGRLDDDLVQEAERYRRPKARYGRLLGWAACFAVVISLGYILTHVGGMGGGAAPSFSGGGNGGAPASGNSASPSEDDNAGAALEPEAPGSPALDEGLAGGSTAVISGTIGVQGGGTYVLTGETLAELPEDGGFVLLGQLLALYPDSPSPYTDAEEYVGLSLWAEDDGTDLPPAVYVELPGGGFAEAVLMQP